MRKFLSSLGLENLLPPSLHSPFSSPNPSRPASPNGATSRRSSSRSRTPAGGDSKDGTNNNTNSSPSLVASSLPKNPEIVEIKALDWEYPVSPFTQQQASPRPLPFREHSSSSIITVKTPIPPSPQQRSRSRIRNARTPRRVASPDSEVPVPKIMITSATMNSRSKGEGFLGLQPLGVTRELVWRYRRHRGICLVGEEGLKKEEEFWKRLGEQGITGVKISVNWDGHMDRLSELDSAIDTARSYGLAVLLEFTSALSMEKEDTTSVILDKAYGEILVKHGNIIGLELPTHMGTNKVQEPKERYERFFQSLSEINTEIPIFIPVNPTHMDLESWATWIREGQKQKKWKNNVVMDIVLESSLGKHTLAGNTLKGIDWVLTATDECPEQKANGWEEYGGWWSTGFDISNIPITVDSTNGQTLPAVGMSETRTKAMKMKNHLKEGAGREFAKCSEEEDDKAKRRRKEVFQMGWEVGYVDALSFWCGQGEKESSDKKDGEEAGVGLGLGLGINMNVNDSERIAQAKATDVEARVGLVNAWVEKRTKWWVEVNKEKEKKKKPAGCAYTCTEGGNEGGFRVEEFAEGMRRGVESFVKEFVV